MRKGKDTRLFEKGPDGKLRYIPGSWKNMFHVDWIQLMYIIAIILILFSYRVSMTECKYIIETVSENPCQFCVIGGGISPESPASQDQMWQPSVNSSFNISVIA